MTDFSNVFAGHRLALPLGLIAVAAMFSACGEDQRQHLNPAAPSAIVSISPALSAKPSEPGPTVVELPLGGQPIGPADVTFPPRNEPLVFRSALETKYRDGLRRSAANTFVDQEGTIVWAQEYLRYRVNLCSHAEAVLRVFRQIDGQGVSGPCGTTNSVVFPPRNEPLDFMTQLEVKYRDGLRRASQPSFVDVEGNIVWTQEYLRYRVAGCGHAAAQDRVFLQIDGRGVQPDCVVSPPSFTGSWAGRTAQGFSLSFTVNNNIVSGVSVQLFCLTSVIQLNFVVSGAITGDAFTLSGGNNNTVTGRFTSSTTAAGSVAVPGCSANSTWEATKR